MGKEGATGLERAAQHISRRLSPPFSPPHVLLLVSLKHRTKVSQEKMPSLSDGSPEAFAAEHVFGGPNLPFPLSLILILSVLIRTLKMRMEEREEEKRLELLAQQFFLQIPRSWERLKI